MNKAIRICACIALATFAAICAAAGSDLAPVTDLHPSHLGITIEAPGSDGWFVSEERFKKGWRVLYRHEDSADSSRTSGVFLKADQYGKGKFAREHGSLEQLAQTVLNETRMGGDPRFVEKWAELVRDDIQGAEAWRIRIAWEERRNPYFPNAVLLMEVAQVLMLHPQDPDRIISIAASTRYKLEQEKLSADALAASFVGAMKLE